jgi:hypothetical protein
LTVPSPAVTGRWRELSLVHSVELSDDDHVVNLFDATALPPNIVPTDYPRIERAAAHFRSVRGWSIGK